MSLNDLTASSASRDAIDGFDAIVVALDHGLDSTGRTRARLGDVIAIALGWFILGAIIFYPSLQLIAIAVCAAFLGTRSFARLVLGPSPSNVPQHDEKLLLAA
jgi:hypothetical protein